MVHEVNEHESLLIQIEKHSLSILNDFIPNLGVGRPVK